MSTSWEVASCAATQNLPSILRNPKVHYCVHKSPPLVPTLSHINLISILILSQHIRQGLPNGLFPSDFHTNILYAFLRTSFICDYYGICLYFYVYILVGKYIGARGSVVGWGTMLQPGMSRVRFPVRQLDFSIDLIFPAVLWSWVRLSF
jgi:hypothetical protein